jgi:hypothetical protein
MSDTVRAGELFRAALKTYERAHNVGTAKLVINVAYDGDLVIQLNPPYERNKELPWHRVVGVNMDVLAKALLDEVTTAAAKIVNGRVESARAALAEAVAAQEAFAKAGRQ